MEDHLEAGAVLHSLQDLGFGAQFSLEATAAAALFAASEPDLDQMLHECVSGREPVAMDSP